MEAHLRFENTRRIHLFIRGIIDHAIEIAYNSFGETLKRTIEQL